MEILRSISLYTESKNMPFVLIGGHAINVYGLPRQTGDIDLLVPLRDKEHWQVLLSKLKYSVFQSSDNFLRSKSETLAAWPIDLMFVDPQSFEKIYSAAILKSDELYDVKVVSAEHLIMLKIHALKTYQEHRWAKDYNDLLFLLEMEDIKITKEELKSLCLKYANLELYNRLASDLATKN